MHSFDVDSDVITLGIYEVIELGLSYWDFDGCIYGNIESLVIGFQYFINVDVGWYVSGCLGTGFGRDVDLITLGIDEGIELVFSDRYFEVLLVARLGDVQQEYKMVPIMELSVLLMMGWVNVLA